MGFFSLLVPKIPQSNISKKVICILHGKTKYSLINSFNNHLWSILDVLSNGWANEDAEMKVSFHFLGTWSPVEQISKYMENDHIAYVLNTCSSTDLCLWKHRVHERRACNTQRITCWLKPRILTRKEWKREVRTQERWTQALPHTLLSS